MRQTRSWLEPLSGRVPAPEPAVRVSPSPIDFVKEMTQLLSLRIEVATIVLVGNHGDRDSLDDAEAVALDADHFLGVVGQEAELPNAQVEQNLSADAVVTQVRPEAEPPIGLNRVES